MAKRGLALAASLVLLVMAAVPVTARNVNADNLYGVHIICVGSDSGRRPRQRLGHRRQLDVALVGLRQRNPEVDALQRQHGRRSWAWW